MDERPLSARSVEPIDRARIRNAVCELLAAIGEDPDRSELSETPARFADAYAEFFAGVGADPLALLRDSLLDANEAPGELVLLRDINFRSMCEHHLLPFRGRAHVAYRPAGRLVGLGTLARLVDTLAARPQLQERLGEQIADALQEALQPGGVLVVLEANQGCVSDRGTRQVDAHSVNVASRGALAAAADRAEVLALIAARGIDTGEAP